MGPGDLEEANWRARIAAVENVLASWRQRALSFRGRALVIGSLALSRIWYVASLIHMPLLCHPELARLIFPFFWKGKPDLVAREVVTQPPTAGGFSVVDIKLKVSSLLVQWIRRYASSPSSWVPFFSFWFSNQFHATIDAVLANPSAYYSSILPLPPFIVPCCLPGGKLKSRVLNAAPLLSLVHFPLIIAVLSLKPLLSMFTNFYSLRAARPPHCVEKFHPQYGDLYWSSTWSQLFCFNLDRPVIDLSWKVAHGVLYTADRLIGFRYDIDATCFCNTALETPSHLFFFLPARTKRPFLASVSYALLLLLLPFSCLSSCSVWFCSP